MTSLLTVSPSPHVRSGMTTQKIMLLVVLALVPAIVAATVVFGPRALFLVVFCAVISMFTEMVCQKLMQKETTYTDGSAMLTGVLLALNLPATLPLWEAAIGWPAHHRRPGCHRHRQAAVRRTGLQLCQPRHYRTSVPAAVFRRRYDHLGEALFLSRQKLL